MAVNVFDPNFYRAANPDLAGFSDAQALSHFQNFGLNEGRRFSSLVDLNVYRASNPDLAGAGLTTNQQLFNHLQNFGVAEGRQFSLLTDLNFYRFANGDLAAAGVTNNEQLFNHLQQFGLNEGRSFSPIIDLGYYIEVNPDVAQAGFTPAQALQQLELYGLSEGRTFSPFFDASIYAYDNPDVVSAGLTTTRQLLEHFVRYGIEEARTASEVFDANYYRSIYQDLNSLTPRAALYHFQAYGADETRRASASFDVGYYLSRYPDLASAGQDGSEVITHYLVYGINEGRRPVLVGSNLTSSEVDREIFIPNGEQEVQGTLNGADESNPTRLGSLREDYRLVGLAAGQSVTLSLDAVESSFDPVLQIIDAATGEVVAENDDIATGNLNSQLSFTAEANTNYIARVTSLNLSEQGDYTLLVAPSTTLAGSLTLGQAVEGSLGDTDFLNPTRGGRVRDDYSLPELSAGQLFQIRLDGDFNGYLQLINTTTGQVVAQNNDISRTNFGSVISFTAEEDANYIVRVTSYGLNETGDYTLTALPITVSGQTTNGSLSASDALNQTRQGAFSDDYVLADANAGQSIRVNLTSDNFDTFLQIINADTGEVAFSNDDANVNTNNSGLTFTPVAGVNYLVRVTSFNPDVTGSYTLSTTPVVDFGSLGTEGFGFTETLEGSFYEFFISDDEFDDERITFSVDSDDFDATLQLIDRNGNIIVTNNNGSDNSAQLSFFPAQYEGGTVRVLSSNGGEGGEFSVNIERLNYLSTDPINPEDTYTLGALGITVGEQIRLNLDAEFDGTIELLAADGTVISSSNDPNSDNAELAFTAATGQRIRITGVAGEEFSGEYDLTPTRLIALGDVSTAANNPFDEYSLATLLGERYRIGSLELDLRAVDFNATLEILDQNGVIVASNNDPASNNAFLTFVVAGDMDGPFDYTVRISGVGATYAGSYNLSTSTSTPSSSVGGDLSTDPVNPEESFNLADLGNFSDGDIVQLDLATSDNLDGNLRVFRSGGMAEPGEVFLSEVDTFIFDDDFTYQVVVSDFGNNDSGSFTLEARRVDATGDLDSDTYLLTTLGTFAQGERVLLDVSAFGDDSQVQVLRNGQLVASNDTPNSFDSQLTFTIQGNPSEYTVVVSSGDLGDDEGSYTLNAVAIAANSTIAASDAYDDFNLSDFGNFAVGEIVQIDLNAGDPDDAPSFNTYLQLINAQTGEIISFDDDIDEGNSNSSLTFTVQSGINYRIRATSLSESFNGDYSLTAFATRLAPTYVSGDVSAPAEEDTYTLDQLGTFADGSSIRIATSGSTDTFIEIFDITDPTSPTLVTDNDDDGVGNNAEVTFTKQAGVTYQVRVSGAGGTAQGPYILFARPGNEPGNVVASSLSTGGETDTFNLSDLGSFAVGDVVQLEELLDDIRTTIQVYDDDDLTTPLPTSNVNGRIIFSVEANIDYVIQVKGTDNTTGNYVLSASLAGGFETDNLNASDRYDDYRLSDFDAVPGGATITLTSNAVGQNPPVNTRLEVFDLNGTLIASNDPADSTNASLTLEAIPEGAFVRVTSADESFSGPYNLVVTPAPVDNSVTGAIDNTPRDPSDTIPLSAFGNFGVGQRVTLDLRSRFDGQISLIDAETDVVLFTGNGDDEISFVVQPDVNYAVLVSGVGTSYEGDYTVFAEPLDASGFLSNEPVNRRETYSLNDLGLAGPAVGQQVEINLTSADFDTLVELLADDVVIASSDDAFGPDGDSLNSRLVFTVQEGVNYRVRVLGFEPEYAGAYDLTAQVYDLPTISSNGEVSGYLTDFDPRAIDALSGRDDYRLTDLEVGKEVRINLNSNDFDGYLELINGATGEVIASNDDGGPGELNDQLTFTVEQGIDYIVRVTNAFANGVGAYTLFTTSDAANSWFVTNIQDAGLRDAVRNRAQDGEITRNELLQIFSNAGLTDGGVINATELAGLTAILNNVASNAARFELPDYVQYLAEQVVTEATGGISTTDFNTLVQAVFRGAGDLGLPSAVFSEIDDNDQVVRTYDLTFQTVQGTLYGPNDPQLSDIQQGRLGNSPFLAALAALPNSDLVEDMIIDNGDDTYSIRFFNEGGQAEWVTVDQRLPFLTGDLLGAGINRITDPTSPNNVLWVSLVERAYAQWRELNEGVPGYTLIGNGDTLERPLAAITGFDVASSDLSFADAETFPFLNDVFNEGAAITVSGAVPGSSYFIPGHAYSVIDVYQDNNQVYHVVVRNPWGVDVGAEPLLPVGEPNDGIIDLTAAQLAENGFTFAAAAVPPLLEVIPNNR